MRPELFLLDKSLEFRASTGRAEPMNSAIHFVEFNMDKEIGRRFAEQGEYATVADILKKIAAQQPRAIVVDVIYTWGRKEDQEILAKAIAEIEAAGISVVLPVSIENNGLLSSLPEAGGDAFSRGVVNVTPDDHWREYQMVHQYGGATMPSLALAAFGAGRGGLAPAVHSPGVMSWKELKNGAVAEESVDDTEVFLNLNHSYYKSPRVLNVEQLESLPRSDGNPGALFGATVFFGYGAELDGKPTAHGDMEPGMWLHGTALNDLLAGTSIRKAPLSADLLSLVLAALGAGLLFYLVERKRWLLPLVVAGFLVFVIVGGVLVLQFCLLVGAVNAAIVWGLVSLVETVRRWALEERERLQRDAMLGFYFSPAILKQVTKNLGMIDPKGADVAVLLSDLRGFTNLCETREVERVFELLNRLFAVETEAALEEGGSLSRFAGDQFLAYWGAPEPYPDSSDRALRAALKIQRTLMARREATKPDDLDSWLNIGVGLHFGSGLTGHVGSRSYRDYNIVGDSVNTTARVEGQTKNYAAPVLATGQFMESLSDAPPSLKVDVVQVKGKAQATALHAVFLEFDEVIKASAEQYQSAFGFYERGEFESASRTFSELEDDGDKTIATSAKLLNRRCRELLAESPADWTGVFELKSK